MTYYIFFYYPYVPFTNAQATLLKVVAIYFKAAYIMADGASATISFVLRLTLLLIVAVTTRVLGLFGSSIFPGADLAIDLNNGKRVAMGNGSLYLMKIKGR